MPKHNSLWLQTLREHGYMKKGGKSLSDASPADKKKLKKAYAAKKKKVKFAFLPVAVALAAKAAASNPAVRAAGDKALNMAKGAANDPRVQNAAIQRIAGGPPQGYSQPQGPPQGPPQGYSQPQGRQPSGRWEYVEYNQDKKSTKSKKKVGWAQYSCDEVRARAKQAKSIPKTTPEHIRECLKGAA